MQKNKRYYIGKSLNWLKSRAFKVYEFIAGKKGIRRIILESLISYYLDNKNNIVEEVKNKKQANQTLEPEITKE